jgi:hypothetical protein
MRERKIGPAALVPVFVSDKTEVPGDCGSPAFSGKQGERQPRFSRGFNPTGV